MLVEVVAGVAVAGAGVEADSRGAVAVGEVFHALPVVVAVVVIRGLQVAIRDHLVAGAMVVAVTPDHLAEVAVSPGRPVVAEAWLLVPRVEEVSHVLPVEAALRGLPAEPPHVHPSRRTAEGACLPRLHSVLLEG